MNQCLKNKKGIFGLRGDGLTTIAVILFFYFMLNASGLCIFGVFGACSNGEEQTPLMDEVPTQDVGGVEVAQTRLTETKTLGDSPYEEDSSGLGGAISFLILAIVLIIGYTFIKNFLKKQKERAIEEEKWKEKQRKRKKKGLKPHLLASPSKKELMKRLDKLETKWGDKK